MARSPAPRRRPRPAPPRHPRVGSPVIRWPHGAPAPPSAQNLTAMRGLDGGNGADGGTHTRIVQPPARGPDRHAPGPGGPGPPGPGRPGLEHRPPAPGGRQGASTHGPHRQSHTRLPSPPPHRRVRHAQLPSRRGRRPAIRNQLHRPQAHLISDPHPARHIDHSSEPVMVQPPPDTTQFQPSFSSAKCTSRRQAAAAHDSSAVSRWRGRRRGRWWRPGPRVAGRRGRRRRRRPGGSRSVPARGVAG